MTSPFGFDPDGFKTAPMRRLAAYWLSKCTADRLPSRTAILPEEIVRDLPFVYLVDVLDEPPAFRFRLVGTQVSIWSERDYTGTTLNAAEYGPKWEPIHNAYRDLVAARRPMASELYAPWLKREFHYYERFIAPLSEDNTRINMIYGALHVIEKPKI
jgi:hypothetical protein